MNTIGKILAAGVTIFAMSALANAQSDAGNASKNPDSAAEEKPRKVPNENATTTGTDNPNAAPSAAKQDKPAKAGKKEKKAKNGGNGSEQEDAGKDATKSTTNNTRGAPVQDPARSDGGRKKSKDNASTDED